MSTEIFFSLSPPSLLRAQRMLNCPSPLICYIKLLNHYELNLQQLQETGDWRRETGDRICETGDMRHKILISETGDVRQEM